MSDEHASTGVGVGFYAALTIVFIGLKLAHVVEWSWLVVFTPLWLPLGLVLVAAASVALIATPFIAWASLRQHQRQRARERE